MANGKIVGKQYAGTTFIDGAECDLNVFEFDEPTISVEEESMNDADRAWCANMAEAKALQYGCGDQPRLIRWDGVTVYVLTPQGKRVFPGGADLFTAAGFRWPDVLDISADVAALIPEVN